SQGSSTAMNGLRRALSVVCWSVMLCPLKIWTVSRGQARERSNGARRFQLQCPSSSAFRAEALCRCVGLGESAAWHGSSVHDPSAACWYAWQGGEVDGVDIVDWSLVFWDWESFASTGVARIAAATMEPKKIAFLIRISGSPSRNELIS